MFRLAQIRQNISQNLNSIFSDKCRRKAFLIRLFLVLIACASILTTRRYIYRYSNQMDENTAADAFVKLYYPMLDELYASGDFEELRREVHRLSFQEGASAISAWPHLPVLHYYTRGTMVRDARKALEEGTDDLSTLSDGVWAALTILFMNDQFETNDIFSETDRNMIRSYRKESSALLMEDLSLTSDQITALHDSCINENSGVNFDKVKTYVEKYYKNDRTFMIP